ncbi:MAG: M48 family metalloprotease [Candidatus Omnitrophica bacterium]|nr:M48 family metalloprotease [Candidatus Omnitrophota bacterium]
MNNTLKVTLFFSLLVLLFIFLGWITNGSRGMFVALLFSGAVSFLLYRFSDQRILALYRAELLPESEAPCIHAMVRDLSYKSGIPMPRIFLIPSAAPNAFATGRDPQHAILAVTQGILEILEPEELQGVFSHELAHIHRSDLLISSVAAMVAGALTSLVGLVRWVFMIGSGRSNQHNDNPLVLLLMGILMPTAAAVIWFAVSRSQEYAADEMGGTLCRNPLYLAKALQKLESGMKRVRMRDVPPVTAHLFIVNPLVGEGFDKLFSTHPPIEDRIARLERQARKQGI